MSNKEELQWRFLSFKSDMEGTPVHDWFWSLSDDDRYSVSDTFNYLQRMTVVDWEDLDEFDPLDGEGGISEIRIIPDIERDENGVKKRISYRIYGFFGPDEWWYSFLHAHAKERKNDKPGKGIAKRRLSELEDQKAELVEFDFTHEPV